MPQYIEEKEVYYLGYSMGLFYHFALTFELCLSLQTQKGWRRRQLLLPPGATPPDQHLSAYTQDLTRRQSNATKYNIKITGDDKVMQLVVCIYEANILEDSVMEKWEESGDRSWTTTVKEFVKE